MVYSKHLFEPSTETFLFPKRTQSTAIDQSAHAEPPFPTFYQTPPYPITTNRVFPRIFDGGPGDVYQ